MSNRTFGIKASGGPGGPYICFGQIKRDPLTMQLMLDSIEGGFTVSGLLVDDDELFSALERLMVIAPAREGTSLCGPMFWSFKKAVERVIERVS